MAPSLLARSLMTATSPRSLMAASARMVLLLACWHTVSALNVNAPLLAEKHFTRTVRAAHQEVATTTEPLPLTPSYVLGTLTFNLAAHLVGAREAAMALQVSHPPIIDLFSDANLNGLAWGVPGAIAVAAIELWRCAGCSIEDEEAGECPRCSALTSPVLVGTAPLSMLSNAILGDPTIGERSVAMVASRSFDGAPRGLPSSSTLVADGVKRSLFLTPEV